MIVPARRIECQQAIRGEMRVHHKIDTTSVWWIFIASLSVSIGSSSIACKGKGLDKASMMIQELLTWFTCTIDRIEIERERKGDVNKMLKPCWQQELDWIDTANTHLLASLYLTHTHSLSLLVSRQKVSLVCHSILSVCIVIGVRLA